MNRPISTICNGSRTELADMTWAEYKAFAGLNASVLVHGRKSMLHLKHAWDVGIKDTDAMQHGRLVHCLLFEPKEVEARYWPWEGRRAGNKYKEFVIEALLQETGAEVVRAEGEYSMASALVAAQGFLRSVKVQSLISAGTAEQTVLAVEHGLQCKGRIDWVSTAGHTLVDLKTTAEIEGELFGRSFFRFGYDLKLGLYKRWLDRVTNDHWPVEIIVLESKPPHDVAVVPIPDAVLDHGVDKAMRIIERVGVCIKADEWPGIGDEMPLVVPYYIQSEDDLVGYEDSP